MDIQQIYLKTPEEWRKWLQENHTTQKEIWLIYYKKHTGKARVPYNEAVEESLCFGWIDSTIKRIDDERYMQKFTPRNPKSNWSLSNKKRIEKLVGLKKWPKPECGLLRSLKRMVNGMRKPMRKKLMPFQKKFYHC